jgi:transposase
MGPKADQRHQTIFYQYRTDRATRTLRGIDEQIAKAEKAIKGQWQIEKSFRMSKSDLRARPIYHHKPEHRDGRSRCRQTRRSGQRPAPLQ